MAKGDTILKRQKTKGSSNQNEITLNSSQSADLIPNTLREAQYIQNYQPFSITAKMPNISKPLANTKYTPKQRAIAIDIIAGRLDDNGLSHRSIEFFRTVLIMDLYFKYRQTSIDDFEIEFICLSALFLTIKYDNRISTSKNLLDSLLYAFSVDTSVILKLELDILKALGFTLKYPTWCDLYCNYHYKYYGNIKNDVGDIRALGLDMLALCTLDHTFNDTCANKLVLSVIKYSINYYFKVKLNELEKPFDMLIVKELGSREAFLVHKVIDDIGDESYLKYSVSKIRRHIRAIHKNYGFCSFVVKGVTMDEKLL